MRQFIEFESMKDSMKVIESFQKGKLNKEIKKSLKKSVKGLDDVTMAIADPKLVKAIKKSLNVTCITDNVAVELLRKIKGNFDAIGGEKAKNNKNAEIGLAYSIARHTLKFSTDKADTMVMQAVNLLETVEKELNSYTQRIREWYGWHFPELFKIVPEPLEYIGAILKIGNRSNLNENVKSSLSEVFSSDDSKIDEIFSAARSSIGLEITDADEEKICKLCQQSLELAQNRLELSNYLSQRMSTTCPNLVEVVGDFVAAKLISHCGSLSNLAKKAGSTIQVLGAEKALFRAIKTRGKTPKYGLLFNAPLVQQMSLPDKGKMCRSLAAKAALAARIDYNSENLTNESGKKFKKSLEARAKQLTSASQKKLGNLNSKRPMQSKQHNFGNKRPYNPKMDVTPQAKFAKRE